MDTNAKKFFYERYATLESGDATEDFIESLQCAIVRAGGCFKPRSLLEKTTVKELDDILTPNSIAAIFIDSKIKE